MCELPLQRLHAGIALAQPHGDPAESPLSAQVSGYGGRRQDRAGDGVELITKGWRRSDYGRHQERRPLRGGRRGQSVGRQPVRAHRITVELPGHVIARAQVKGLRHRLRDRDLVR